MAICIYIILINNNYHFYLVSRCVFWLSVYPTGTIHWQPSVEDAVGGYRGILVSEVCRFTAEAPDFRRYDGTQRKSKLNNIQAGFRQD
jgi:hypothetical protein